MRSVTLPGPIISEGAGKLLSGQDRRAISLRWAILLILSVILSAGLEVVRLPAALLLGPMVAGILVASAGVGMRVPPTPNLAAQAVIGCMIARSIPPAILARSFSIGRCSSW